MESRMKKIGIICAITKELGAFLPYIQECKTTDKAMLKFYEGKINNTDVVALFCGVCKTNAALATQVLIDTYGVDVVINAGTAGGIDKNLDVFDTVICTEAVYHDVHEGILTEFHPWLESKFFKSDEDLLNLARKVADRADVKGKIYFGRMVTGEQFIVDDGREEIIANLNPLSVDMETAAMAHVCYVNKIPFIAIRSISDTADHSGEDNFAKNCVTASEVAKDIVLELLVEIEKNSNW